MTSGEVTRHCPPCSPLRQQPASRLQGLPRAGPSCPGLVQEDSPGQSRGEDLCKSTNSLKKKNALAIRLEHFLYGYSVGRRQARSSPGPGCCGTAVRVTTGRGRPRRRTQARGPEMAQEPRVTQAAQVLAHTQPLTENSLYKIDTHNLKTLDKNSL